MPGQKVRQAIPVVAYEHDLPRHPLAGPPPYDEVLAATRRYSAMTARDAQRSLPARAWDAIADRLRAAARLVTGDYTTFCLDRASDAHHRAVDAAQIGGAS